MKAKIFSVVLSLLCTYTILLAQVKSHTGTYSNGKTTFYSGESYTTTGEPLVKRSASAKASFLKTLELSHLPEGYEVDHIEPLSRGGEDVLENMQLLTVGQHKLKTAIERGEVAEVKYSTFLNTSFDQFSEKPRGIRNKTEWDNQQSTSPKEIDDELNSNRVLYSGARGGIYYLTPGGKKSYLTASEKKSRSSETSAVITVKDNQETSDSNQASNSGSVPASNANGTREIITGPRGGIITLIQTETKRTLKRINFLLHSLDPLYPPAPCSA